ncbi:MAG: VCBS repeat-containing protein [Planctomycetes bacterium]|nr:VCBS repeat-containing protein [Planctomycetota bacterium]
MRNQLLFPFLSLMLFTAVLGAQPTVSSLSPARHDLDAAPNADISAGFSAAMAAPSAGSFRVRSNLRGWLTGAFSGGGTATLTFDPAVDLLPGEEIEVSLTSGLTDTGATPLAVPHVWRYRAQAGSGPKRLDAVVKSFASGSAWDCAFGDVDNDGDIDMAGAHFVAQNVVWINDGTGNFSARPFGPSNSPTYAVAMADMDNDGDLDIVTGEWGYNAASAGYNGQNQVWFNDGSGFFTTSTGFGAADGSCMSIALGDLDGDGDVDIVEGNGGVKDEANGIYLNDGSGNLTRKGFPYYSAYPSYEVVDNTWEIRLGDADNDGDLDVFAANFGLGTAVQSYVWLNDSAANFEVASRVNIGGLSSTLTMCVADFDGDADLDVALGANTGFSSYIYWNNNTTFTTSSLIDTGGTALWAIAAGDIDGDGDLDLGLGYEAMPSKVMLNDGAGNFTYNYYLGGSGAVYAMEFADADGDGDLDVGTPTRLCINGSNRPQISVTSGGAPVVNGGTLNANYNTALAYLNLQIQVTDQDGDYAKLEAQVSNLNTQGITLSEFSKSVSATPYSLAPVSGVFNQGGITHTVTLTATDIGESSVFSFDIVVAPPPAPLVEMYEISLGGSPIGNGAAPGGQRDFGNQDPGAGPTTALNVVIYNGGTANLNLGGVSISGANATDFVLDANSMANVLTPGNSTSFNVQFDPNSTGAKTATIEVIHNDTSTATPFTFGIAGMGALPAVPLIVVKEGAALIGNGSGAGGSRNFGSLTVGNASAPVTITVENAGTADLTLGAPALSGPGASQFSLDATGMLATVPAGQSTSFTVIYTAAAEGTFGAIVSFSHNDASTGTPFSFGVVGSATAASNGNSAGGGSGGGGGCAAGEGAQLWTLLLLVIAGIALCRKRRAHV